MFVKIGVFKNFAIFTEKVVCNLFLNPSGLQFYEKKTRTQLFFGEYCQIFEDNNFYRTPPVV